MPAKLHLDWPESSLKSCPMRLEAVVAIHPVVKMKQRGKAPNLAWIAYYNRGVLLRTLHKTMLVTPRKGVSGSEPSAVPLDVADLQPVPATKAALAIANPRVIELMVFVCIGSSIRRQIRHGAPKSQKPNAADHRLRTGGLRYEASTLSRSLCAWRCYTATPLTIPPSGASSCQYMQHRLASSAPGH